VTTPGLTLTRQAPADAVTISLDADTTPTRLARAVTRSADIQDALVATLHEAADGKDPLAFRDHLVDDVGITQHDEFLADAIVNAVRAYPREELKSGAVLRLLRAVHGLAGGQHTHEDDLVAPRLLALTHATTPTVAVRLEDGFLDDVRRDQRERVCEYLAELAQGCDVRVVATGRLQLKLYQEHRSDLPVSQSDITLLADGPARDEILAAANDLDPDGRPVQLLRDLRDASTETRSYGELYASASVSKSRVRQCLSRLVDHDLVATYDSTSGKHVDLLDAGRRVLDALDADYGRQAELDECVSEPRQSSPQAVYSRGDTTGPGTARGPYRTAYLDRSRHATAAAAAVDGGMTAVPHPVNDEDSRVRGVSVDEDRGEVVAEWTARSGLQYVVSAALALASPHVLHEVLDDHGLAAVEEPEEILRGARQIGALSDEALADAQSLREAFVEWAERIEDMTRRHHSGDCEDRSQHRRDIMRAAHGLYGSLVHLFDALDYDVIRAVRVPRGLDESHREEIATAVAHSALVQSAYGVHAAFRQLYEGREDKRQSAWGVDVDARDPYGRLLGSFVFVGRHAPTFVDTLEPHLEGRDVHEDAPEFAVPYPVRRQPHGETLRRVVRRVLAEKHLQLSEPAARLLGVLTGSAYDAAEAVHRGLAPDTEQPGRQIRVDEVRTALTALPEDRLVPDEAPTVQAALGVLLATDRRLSKADLAEEAGVSTRSLARHRDRLEALDVLDVTSNGWRVGIAFNDPEDTALPAWASGDVHLPTVADDVARALLDADQYVAATVPLAAGSGPPDYRPLLEAAPWLEHWLARLATAATTTTADTADDVVLAGPRVEQASLGDAGTRETRGGRG
jgi:hypothetical protein